MLVVKTFHVVSTDTLLIAVVLEIQDSERSDECIDFTMLYGVVSCSKMNLVGALGDHFLDFPIVFKSAGKNQKKIKEKREFLRKTSFRPNRFFYMDVIQKVITFLMSCSKCIQIFTKSVENAKICNISRRYLKILPKMCIKCNNFVLDILEILFKYFTKQINYQLSLSCFYERGHQFPDIKSVPYTARIPDKKSILKKVEQKVRIHFLL
ncbi:Uncharacterized protein FWK35_00016083 [Aphis craccivora]|uniref:Uncharacterized protein n=1 Tax=Aphis craccivora TaxID=307492 RepID=A0A6G0YNB4_APHCR|nr:Uncharacterized protein FWK35_00016083 [Aphis craccivora]